MVQIIKLKKQKLYTLPTTWILVRKIQKQLGKLSMN